MALCRCLGGLSDLFIEAIVHSGVAFFVGNYMVCNIFLRGLLPPRHAPQALQPTSKPGRPQT
jgi:hypothetical protein